MPDILKASIGDASSVRWLIDEFEPVLPTFKINALNVDADARLDSERVAYHWVDSGTGKVHLSAYADSATVSGNVAKPGREEPLVQVRLP